MFIPVVPAQRYLDLHFILKMQLIINSCFTALGTSPCTFSVWWWCWPYLSSQNAGRPGSSWKTHRGTTHGTPHRRKFHRINTQISTAQTTTATRRRRPHEVQERRCTVPSAAETTTLRAGACHVRLPDNRTKKL